MVVRTVCAKGPHTIDSPLGHPFSNIQGTLPSPPNEECLWAVGSTGVHVGETRGGVEEAELYLKAIHLCRDCPPAAHNAFFS